MIKELTFTEKEALKCLITHFSPDSYVHQISDDSADNRLISSKTMHSLCKKGYLIYQETTEHFALYKWKELDNTSVTRVD